jgi:hypothetical protein
MIANVEGALAQLQAIDLGELEDTAALRERHDHKYLVPIDSVVPLIRALGSDYRALEIDEVRRFAYESVYFDTADYGSYRAHRQGRRLRFKARTRSYADSGPWVFEVKLTSGRATTSKLRIPCRQEDLERVTPEAMAFLDECLVTHHGASSPRGLRPVLRTTYVRTTLVGPGGAERVTFDFNPRFASLQEGGTVSMRRGFVIVETKAASNRSLSDRLIQEAGLRPRRFSKYCCGLALTGPVRRPNWLLPSLRLAFEGDGTLPAAARGGSHRRPADSLTDVCSRGAQSLSPSASA